MNHIKFMRMGWIAVMFLVLTASESLAQRSEMLFRFDDGSTLVGALQATSTPSTVAVNSRLFESPLVVSLDQLLEARAIETESHTVATNASSPSDHRFAFELSDGCLLIGTPEGQSGSVVKIQTRRFGTLAVDTKLVQQMVRADLMPKQLFSMSDSIFRIRREEGWRIQEGLLIGQQPGAAAVADFELPVRFRLRLKVTCQGNPDFELTLGDRSKGGAGQGGRVDRRGSSLARLPSERFVTAVEWFGKDVSLVRANFSVAEASVFESAGSNRSLDVELCVDQSRGQLLVYQDGLLTGEAAVQDSEPVLRQMLTLINRGDDVTVERLQLFQWDGNRPQSRRLPERFTELADGSVIDGAADEFSAEQFRVGQTWYPTNELARMHYGQSISRAGQGGLCGVVLGDGTRIRGPLLSAKQAAEHESEHLMQTLSMTNPAGNLRFDLSTTDVVQLIGNATEVLAGRRGAGKLISGETVLAGRLTETESRDGRLGWQTSLMSSPRVITVESDTEIRFDVDARVADQGRESVAEILPTIQLSDGDIVSASLVSLRAGRAEIRGESFGQANIPADSIHQVSVGGSYQATPEDIEMAMQLPRRQQDSPPTHLLISVTGDVLRGKLIDVGTSALRIEVRGVKRSIPRQRIGQIQFLKPNGDEPPARHYRIETFSGTRLSVDEVSVDGSFFRCQHALLGKCRFDLDDLKRIQFSPDFTPQTVVPEFVPVREPKTFE